MVVQQVNMSRHVHFVSVLEAVGEVRSLHRYPRDANSRPPACSAASSSMTKYMTNDNFEPERNQ